jgi:hypothetical protein
MSDAPEGLGPTGKFPHGKLNATDEGELTIAIGKEAGNVVVEFGTPTAWVAMPPDRALAFAAVIVKHAMDIKRGAG